jgi:hypothetical protein
MRYKIRTNLPERIHGVRYVKNSHYLELEDEQERAWRGGATGIVKYTCQHPDCKSTYYQPSNNGKQKCPVLGCDGMALPIWHKAQLSFVPEEPSQYRDGYLSGFVEGDFGDGSEES